MFEFSTPKESPPPLPRNTQGTASNIRHDVIRTIDSGVQSNVTNAHAMVPEIHHAVVRGQEGSSGEHPLVSDSCAPTVIERPLTFCRLKQGQKSKLPADPSSDVRI